RADRLDADLACARAVADEQRGRSSRLDRDLKVAHSHLACALTEARELKARLDTLEPIELLPSPGQPPQPRQAVAALQKLGAKVEEGLGMAGPGVLEVDLSG